MKVEKPIGRKVKIVSRPFIFVSPNLHGNTVNSRHHVALMRAGVFPHGSKPVVGGNETYL